MRHTTAWVLIILVLGGAAAWYLNARKPVEGHPSTLQVPLPDVTEQALPPVAEFPVQDLLPPDEPAAETEDEPEPLPELTDSDGAMAEIAGDLLGADVVAGWLITEQLIQRFVATVDSLDSGRISPLVLPVRPPSGKFLVDEGDEVFTVSRFNADRYEPYATVAASLNVDAAVAAYARYYPLFQQAYEELGFPGAYFNDRLVAVLDHLLATPEVTLPQDLLRSEAVFIYADEDLEALSAGQKLMLRLGAENRRKVQSKLGELRAALTRTPPG